MRGMTKANCKAFERLCETEISKVLGPGVPWGVDGLEWSMPYGKSGYVSIHLIRDSFKPGPYYRSPFLACRLNGPEYVDANGYASECPGPFGRTSHKYNLHPGYTDSLETMTRDLALHLYAMAERDSKYKLAFGDIRFKVAA